MTTAPYTTISADVDEAILTVTLNRPDQLNSFTLEMAQELEHVFRWADGEDSVRAIIVTGAGRAFCAGMNLSGDGEGGNVFGLDESQRPTLNDLRERGEAPEIRRGVRDIGGLVTLAIYDCRKPVIGAVNGAAVGIGATMLLPMDIRIASDAARIGFVFGRIGVTPEACSTWFLPRIVGIAKALEWFYSADIMPAEQLLEGGLLKQVVAPDALLPTARAIAHSVIDNRSSVSLALIRQMVYRNSSLSHPRGAHDVDSLSMFYSSLGDGKEGIAAFLEKRAPEFTSSPTKDMPPFYPWW